MQKHRWDRLARLMGAGIGCLFALVLSFSGASGSGIPGWDQGSVSGFGSSDNAAISSLDVFAGALYAGTWNQNGAQVWRTSGGRQWAPVTPPWGPANSAIDDAQPFGAYLYFGTANENGGEIWRTDGAAWEQVAATGLGDESNYAMNAFGVFNGQLYMATSNLTTGIEVWRSSTGNSGTWQQVNNDGFGGDVTWEDTTLEVFSGHLYAGISRLAGSGGRAELWRSIDGTQWQPVFTNGLGYASNTNVSAMTEFQGQLYIGLRNAVSGGQLWRSNNGLDWSPVFTDGLGKPANSRPYGLLAHNGQLYLVFSNIATGAEVWRSANGTTWQPVMQGGWGDPANGFADYFDKAATVFQGALTVGTVNETAGGQVWQMLHLTYLPHIQRR